MPDPASLDLDRLIDGLAIAGVIFDMDGVLADTKDQHLRSWVELYRNHRDSEPSLELLERTFGQTNATIIPQLFGSPVDVEALGDEKERIYREIARRELEPMPGIDAFLGALRQRDVRTAVGTSGPPENVAMLIELFDWQHAFDAVVDTSQFERSKPDPQCFLVASERIGVAPERCVVFEDSIHGLEAAHRAGMLAVGVVGTLDRATLERESDHVIDDFRSLLRS